MFKIRRGSGFCQRNNDNNRQMLISIITTMHRTAWSKTFSSILSILFLAPVISCTNFILFHAFLPTVILTVRHFHSCTTSPKCMTSFDSLTWTAEVADNDVIIVSERRSQRSTYACKLLRAEFEKKPFANKLGTGMFTFPQFNLLYLFTPSIARSLPL